MKKLIKGIVEFRQNVKKEYLENFGRLATGQAPDALFVACSDSRVVPNTFASTDPGDLFVIRNVGNLIPPCDHTGQTGRDFAEAAAIEFSTLNLNVKDIIICGHSECGAMMASLGGREKIDAPNLKNWLCYADDSLKAFQSGLVLDPNLDEHNQLSQLNVLKQMEHVLTYPSVKKKVDQGELAIHGWWFDIAQADVYAFDPDENRFLLIDSEFSKKIISKLV